MNTPAPNRSTPHRFPAERMSHGVWRYGRWCLSDRAVDELGRARGMIVPDAAIQQWCWPCGPADAHQLRRRRPRPGDTWHVDEVFLTSTGARHALWRAGDQEGHRLDRLGHRCRNTQAAQQCVRTRLQGLTSGPRVLITDPLNRDGVATRALLPSVAHRQHRSWHTRAANAHQPTRPRARRRPGVKAPGPAPRFRSADGPLAQHCRSRRHRRAAQAYRQARGQRFQRWPAVTGRAAA